MSEQKVPSLPQVDPLLQPLLKTRTIILSGEVNKELAEKIVKQLLWLESENSDPIFLCIDSPGGDVDAGFAIYDMIRFIQAPVYIIGIGLVASAAALILLAVPSERRLGFENSRYLLHQPLSGMRGFSVEIEIHAQEIEKLHHKLNELIASATNKQSEQVAKDTDRDYWLNASEAVAYGLITSTIQSRNDLEKHVK